MKCKTYQLHEICTFIDYRGKTPPKTTSGIPLITAKIVKNGCIQEPQEFIAADFFDEWMRRGIPKKGSVIFTTEAPLGEVARISTNAPIAFAQRIIVLEPKATQLDGNYLFYALQSDALKKEIGGRATGTTVFGIKAAELKKISVDLPDLAEQKAIASILSALDDKIELNNRINKNLETQAQAIFKSWFVDFEPFRDGEFVDSELGPIPKGWRVGLLSELIKVKYGKDHKKLEDGPIPAYGSGGIMRYVSKALYEKESVLIPRKGTLSNVIYINEPFWTVDTMFYSEMNFANIAKYIYFTVKSKDLASMNAGTAVPSMTTDILNNILVIIPTEKVFQSYNQVVSPMFQMLETNCNQTKKLAAIRDTLLPKLMSGEIRVPLEV